MISNLSLLFLALAKVALYTGLGPGIAIAIILELCDVRIVEVGVEQVSARAVSSEKIVASDVGNQPAREVNWRTA